MRKKDMTNAEILKRYTNSCFRVTNYPDNKKEAKEHDLLFREIARRLNLTPEEIQGIIDTW